MNVVSMLDIRDYLPLILEKAVELKEYLRAGTEYTPLKGKTLGMIFEKPSTRTRVSFEVAMTQLGGHAIYMSPKDLQVGRGETIADTAKVLSRYVDGIVYRAFSHKNVVELAEHSSVPVINALDDVEHPCQILADLLTVEEKKGGLEGLKMCYVGDGNNVCNSLILGCAMCGMDISVGCPEGYDPDPELLKEARKIAEHTGSRIEVMRDPGLAAERADVIYTDVWASMGQEEEEEQRKKVFQPYQVNSVLLASAKDDVIVMHCLPAHRGLEITDEVLDGPHSVVFDQAENRLHAQKALLSLLLK